MVDKFTLSIISIILLLSMVSCGQSTTPTDQSNTSSTETQDSQGSTIPETHDTDNYQMLPLISGKVAKLQLDAGADGSTQQLAVGEVMGIALESNPSTGYGWFANSTSPEVIASMGDPVYQEPTASTTPIVGAAGTEIFYFQATATGTAKLTLEYKKGWETEVAPEKTITITVEVK